MLKPRANTAGVHDIWHYEAHPLDAIFRPTSVALVGATERPNSIGRTILWNLLTNTSGATIFPVNLKRKNVLGIKAYPSVKKIPDHVDLAVIVTPASTARLLSPPASKRPVRRARNSSARCWPPLGRETCGSSAPTAWAS